MSTYPLLSLAIWIPIVSGLVVLATGSDRNAPLARMLALFGSIAAFLVTIPLWTGFDIANGGMQFSVRVNERKQQVHLFARRNGGQDFVVIDLQAQAGGEAGFEHLALA